MDEASLKQQALSLWSEGCRRQMQGDLEDAVRLYSESIRVFPTAEAFTFRGWAYSFMGRIDDAIAECRRAIEVDPDFGNPYNDIGSYLLAKGQPDQAIEWLEKAKTAPRYEPRHFPFMNLGRLYASKGMVRQAIEELEGALRIEPDEPTCAEMLRQLRLMLN